MKFIITSIFLSITFMSYAKNSSIKTLLCEFNPNWKNHIHQIKESSNLNYSTEVNYVKLHLSHVISILKSNSINHLSFEQIIMRNYLISELIKYEKGNLFPQNYYVKARIPVFIDEQNTYCAVGYLMKQSGYDHLALNIAKDNNYAWVKEIKTEGLVKWQNLSGFSLEELKLIQGAYNYYPPLAFLRDDRYDIPQKPEVITRLLTDGKTIWCKGEGKKNILNGQWLQYYSNGKIWIIGSFKNGLKHGQWYEYYKGTDQICRTELWENDKLNGVRKRYNRSGILIEEIYFENSEALTKTNYNLLDSTRYIRTLINENKANTNLTLSNSAIAFETFINSLEKVNTKIYDYYDSLIAEGTESVINNGGLKWFQNIELTALNSINHAVRTNPFSFDRIELYNETPLVVYEKDSNWVYYSKKQLKPENSKIEPEIFISSYPIEYKETYIDINFATVINFFGKPKPKVKSNKTNNTETNISKKNAKLQNVDFIKEISKKVNNEKEEQNIKSAKDKPKSLFFMYLILVYHFFSSLFH